MYGPLISSIILLFGCSHLIQAHDDKAYCASIDKSYCAFNYHVIDCPHKCSKGFSFVGCFKDLTSDRAISGGGTTFSLSDVIDKCYAKAVTDSRTYFGVQGSKCFTAANAGTTYNKHGVSTACQGGKGATDAALDVYKIAGSPGHWSAWGNFASCTNTCGKGTRKKVRTCTGSTGGAACPGNAELTENCYDSSTCAAHTALTDIAADLCYTTCDNTGGKCPQSTKNKCPTGAICCKSAAAGVSACGSEVAAASPAAWTCMLLKTTGNMDGNWGNWGVWGACGASCDINHQSRTRTCDSPSNLGTGSTCAGTETTNSQACNLGACPTPAPPAIPVPAPCPSANPYIFAAASKCCAHPKEKVGAGPGCDGSIIDSSSTCCKSDAEVACVSPTGACVSYTDATKCTLANPFAFDGGAKCCKHPIEKTSGSLGAACDGGILSSSSKCCYNDDQVACTTAPCTGLATPAVCPVATPYAFNKGAQCCGTTTEGNTGGSCNGGTIAFESPCCSGTKVACPNGDKCAHKQTSVWSAWGACSQPCGETGTQQKTRTCLMTAISGTCTESLTESQRCNLQVCPTNGGYSTWTQWTTCSETNSHTCGHGFKSRSRCCDNPKPANGGTNCDALGKNIEIKTCFSASPCGLDGQWNTWGSYGSCEQPCGETSDNYKETRTRVCNFPKNRFSGVTCVGSATEKQACTSISPCPINGGLTAWAAWSTCTSYCKRFTYRCCTNPEKNAQGNACSETGTSIFKKEDCQPGVGSCPPLDGAGNPGVAPAKDNGCKLIKNPPDNVACKFNLKEDTGATFEIDSGLLKAFKSGISGAAVILTMADDGSGLAINGDATNCLHWKVDGTLSKTVVAVGIKASVTCTAFSLVKSGDKYNIVDDASKCTKKHSTTGPDTYYLEQSSTGCSSAHFLTTAVV